MLGRCVRHDDGGEGGMIVEEVAERELHDRLTMALRSPSSSGIRGHSIARSFGRDRI
mgnify:CR=1 FL=1